MARPVRLTAQLVAVAVVAGLLALLVWRVVHDHNKQALSQGSMVDFHAKSTSLWR